jgi:hypothetical protein
MEEEVNKDTGRSNIVREGGPEFEGQKLSGDPRKDFPELFDEHDIDNVDETLETEDIHYQVTEQENEFTKKYLIEEIKDNAVFDKTGLHIEDRRSKRSLWERLVNALFNGNK